MSKPWRIELLGKLQVLHGDSSYSHFETRKTAALLAYLALTLPKASTREQLAEMLWPEEDPEVTRTRLRQCLSALRRVLEPAGSETGPECSVLITDRTSIRLNPETVTTDAAEFDALLRTARKTSDSEARRTALQGAIDLYQGETLPGFYEEFALDARRRLSEAHGGALMELAPLLTARGDHTEAVAVAKQAVAADSSDEATHLCLMRALSAAGRTSDALKQGREMERILRQEWDTAPSEEARAFVETLRSTPVMAHVGAPSFPPPLGEPEPPVREAAAPAADPLPSATFPPQTLPRADHRRAVAALLICAVLIGAAFVWRSHPPKPAPAPGDRRIVAVLPFDISSSDGASDAYFADGLTEEMTNTLGNIGALTVIGRMSAARIKTDLASGGELARDWNVGTLITGHVSKEASRLRVVVEAVDARSQRVIWSEEYDKSYKASEVLEIERDVAQRVAASLRLRLSSGEQDKIARKSTDNFAAYDDYLRGRYLWNQRTEDSLKHAITFFDRAILRDPHYAPAYVGESDAYNVLGYYGYIDSDTASRKARFAAAKALEEAGGDSDAMAAACTSQAWEAMVYRRDWRAADDSFTRAIQLSPDYATAHHWRSLYLMLQGRDRESMDEIGVALKKDPLSFIIETSLGGRYYHERRYDQALRQYDEVLNLNPGYTVAYFWRALAREKAGMRSEAQGDLQRAVAGSHRTPLFLAFLAKNYAESGRRDQALAIRDELRRRNAREYVSPFCMAVIDVGLDDKDSAFRWLQTAYDAHDGALTFFGEAPPAFDSLRSDARYALLRQKMGLTKI
ncbi:hypothetical protein CCAX7_65570 [Capsulimonas corticalis]|uniref:Uncharacterized protein n=1 Tax=Capsulimonas corticalis TaxID=2219043 RepID=A0A402CQU2_9BACT|nr:BTAD domain-containing putative transcriptional regulator [Capsulimonas corticalis]BDI34506.1 hypothetical protein CCAX7_65570 [Capsulimonas corticalis]